MSLLCKLILNEYLVHGKNCRSFLNNNINMSLWAGSSFLVLENWDYVRCDRCAGTPIHSETGPYEILRSWPPDCVQRAEEANFSFLREEVSLQDQGLLELEEFQGKKKTKRKKGETKEEKTKALRGRGREKGSEENRARALKPVKPQREGTFLTIFPICEEPGPSSHYSELRTSARKEEL